MGTTEPRTTTAEEGPGDPGHLLPDRDWARVVQQAEEHDRGGDRPAAFATFAAAAPAAGPTVLSRPARFRGGSQTPTVQVIHDAETPISDGYAIAIGDYFADGPPAGTSAHRMIGPRTIVRMLPGSVIGYHCGPAGNRGTVGYEQCGYAAFTRAQWTTADGRAQIATLAGELARDAEAWGIPDRRLSDAQLRAWAAAGRPLTLGGRATHDQVARVLGGTVHSDPMPHYPFDLLDSAVTRARAGRPPIEEDDMTPDDWEKLEARFATIRAKVEGTWNEAHAANVTAQLVLAKVARDEGYDVIRGKDDPAVYIVAGDHRVHVTSPAALAPFGGYGAVEVVDPGDPRMTLPVLETPEPAPTPTAV